MQQNCVWRSGFVRCLEELTMFPRPTTRCKLRGEKTGKWQKVGERNDIKKGEAGTGGEDFEIRHLWISNLTTEWHKLYTGHRIEYRYRLNRTIISVILWEPKKKSTNCDMLQGDYQIQAILLQQYFCWNTLPATNKMATDMQRSTLLKQNVIIQSYTPN